MEVNIKLIAVIISILIMFYLFQGSNNKEVNNSKVTSSRMDYVNLNTEESYELIKENEGNKDFVILDVRTPKEYNSGHIANAINMDYNSSEFKNMLATLDTGKTYLVHCRTGNRSSEALKIIYEMGFKNVYHMLGGIAGWIKSGYPKV